jgi:hypothetical protein
VHFPLYTSGCTRSEFTEMSNTNMLISPRKTCDAPPHKRFASVEPPWLETHFQNCMYTSKSNCRPTQLVLCWTAILFTLLYDIITHNGMEGIKLYARCFLQRNRTHGVINVLILCSWQRLLLCLCMRNVYIYRCGRTIKFVNSPPCAYHGTTGHISVEQLSCCCCCCRRRRPMAVSF